MHSERDAELIAARVTQGVVEPFVSKAMTLIATDSVAIAYAGPAGITDQLVISADRAMYQAKHRGDDRARWLYDTPGKPLDPSVNVSGHQLFAEAFCQTVEAMLRSIGMNPASLILALTENVLIEDHARAITVLTAPG